jgi:AbrB family looped-hinge helix DNA binding protein
MGVVIKVDKRGRMVLPKDVRKALGIEERLR